MNTRKPASKTQDFSLPAPIPAQQKRSREAMRKVVFAFQHLLEEKGFDLISMNEVAREAGVSVGTIYTRFPSKDHLLLYLVEETFFARLSLILDELSETAKKPEATLAGNVEAVFTRIGKLYGETRHFFAPLSTVLRMTRDDSLLEPASRYNRDIHARLTKVLLTQSQTIKHKDPEAAIGMIILWGLSALREMVLYDEPVSNLTKVSSKKQIKELCRALTLYLTNAERT